jgi:hypothetical protein
MKARLKSEDEVKEEAFQKRLEQIRAEQAPLRAEREAKEQAEEQERRNLLDEARQMREQEMKDSACSSWLDAGGRAEEFEQEWPSLRTEMLKRRTPRGRDERTHSTEARWRQQPLDCPSRRECPGREGGAGVKP